MKKHVCQRSKSDQAILDEASHNISFWQEKYQRAANDQCPEVRIETKVIEVPAGDNLNGWIAVGLLVMGLVSLWGTTGWLQSRLARLDNDVLQELDFQQDLRVYQVDQMAKLQMARGPLDDLLEKASAAVENGHIARADRLLHTAKLYNESH